MHQRITRLAVLIWFAALVAAGSAGAAEQFPRSIDLPQGFRPEGIAIGKGTTFYVGSISTGDIYRGDLRTGDGEVITQPSDGSASIGVAVDQRSRLFVAGGPTGQGRVFDAHTGDLLMTYQFATGTTFVNDVVITKDSAWFTDSMNRVLYRVPLDLGPAETLQLTGDLVLETGFNVNGIDVTADGRTLVLVQSNTGEVFTADPATGTTVEITLSEPVPFGDGILLHGQTLYVVQNQLNQIAVVDLAPDLSSGVVTDHLVDGSFDIPTTIDRFGNTLYAVNARFTTLPEPTTDYSITAIRRR